MGAVIRAALMSKLGRMVIIGIIASIFLMIFWKKISAFLQTLRRTGTDQYREGWGSVTADWKKNTLSPLVIRVEKALRTDWTLLMGNSERCDVLKSLTTLNNNQLIALSNAYYAYHTKFFSDDVKGAFGDGCYEFFTPDTQLTLIARLNEIGIR